MASAAYMVGVVLTVLSGIALGFETGANATLGRISGSKSFGALISFSVGTAGLIVYFLLDTYPPGKQAPTVQVLRGVPWWAWLGGLMGAYYVAVTVLFANTLGASTITALFVTAQLVTSIFLDCFGLVGFAKRTIQWERILGISLMVAGVILVSVFDGVPKDVKAVAVAPAPAGGAPAPAPGAVSI